MKAHLHSLPKWAVLLTLVVASTFFGFSYGWDRPSASSSVPAPKPVAKTSVDEACAAPIFGLGHPLAISELASAGFMKFELREVHFRNVLSRTPSDVELAYRVEMKMQLNADRFLVPVHTLACNEQNKPSKRAVSLSRTMIPVVGDIHLPSSRITVFDEASAESDLYNYPRISEITVSNGGYFSFNQNWAPYRQVRTISQYMNLLRYRALYTHVELREMGEGWMGIYAEKKVGGETVQLMILLSATGT